MHYCFFGHPKSASTFFGGLLSRIAIEMGKTYFYGQISMKGKVELINRENPNFIISQNSSISSVKSLDRKFKAFHVIRDPRDIWVSSYFSYKKTHAIDGWKDLALIRKSILEKDFEEGMVETLRFNKKFFEHMENWEFGNDQILEIRYEDFIKEPGTWINEIIRFMELELSHYSRFEPFWTFLNRGSHSLGTYKMIRFPRKGITSSRLGNLNDEFSFQSFSKGRKKGQEDQNSHYRKGVSGDWKIVLTPSLRAHFNSEFPNLLTALQYEKDNLWVSE